MVLLTLLAFPVTYFPYLALARFVLAGATHGKHSGNVLDTTNEFLGPKWGRFLTATYFFTVFPVMMIYAITITNTLIDFSKTQLHIDDVSRWVVAPVSIAALMLIVRFGTNVIVRTMSMIVAPFIISIVFFGFLAAAHWNFSIVSTASQVPTIKLLSSSIWDGLPVTVFAFAFTSIVSSFVVAQKEHYGQAARTKVPRILFAATALAVSTMAFFSWSCIFALSPQELVTLKASNLTILSFLARKFDTPALAIASQLIVFTAIIKAFLAHYLATEESARSFGKNFLRLSDSTVSGKSFSWLVIISVFVITVGAAIYNLNVINLITSLFVPANVFIVYFLPLYALFKIEALAPYRRKPTNLLVLAVGLFCLASGVLSIIGKLTG
ncbi:hypothetical protein GCT13_27010 [Paraburkholderia sp. CNPSo 3157]|nr:hypothetical protein [Paraburkholderia franconis]